MLIIYAHPNKTGHCGLVLEEIKTALKAKNINFEILDLYEMGYDPIMKLEEHYTSGNFAVSLENKKLQEKIKNENRFIFIYPTWWNNVPAILKGFFDRVFISRFAFHYEGLIPRGLLRGRAVIFTSIGGPKWYYYFFTCARSIKIVANDVLKFCGIKARGFIVDSAREINDKQKRKIRTTIKKGLAYLNI